MSKNVLLINDLPGYGKVALAAMMPILTHMGINTFNLPTALVSNTLDYGKFDILDTTEYMKNTLKIWEDLNFNFDAIATGFIVSQEQVDLITHYCKKKSAKGTLIFCDPIMGDEGKLYNGIAEKTVQSMRDLCSIADFIVPNYTEACYLTNTPYTEKALTEEEAMLLVTSLRDLGAKNIVVTSMKIKEAEGEINAVVGYEARTDTFGILPFELIPARFPGTGDAFSALMMGSILQGKSLRASVNYAMYVVYKLVKENLNTQDMFKGIPLESCLHLLDLKK